MLASGFGRVITMSPPIVTDMRAYAGKTAYYMSKFGMTMVALGAAAEGEGRGVTGNSLWPATVIESLASLNFKMGAPSTPNPNPNPNPNPKPIPIPIPIPSPSPSPSTSTVNWSMAEMKSVKTSGQSTREKLRRVERPT